MRIEKKELSSEIAIQSRAIKLLSTFLPTQFRIAELSTISRDSQKVSVKVPVRARYVLDREERVSRIFDF